jgi:ABC-type polysaccharide/polyol phosphate transport system ATPase subunit
MSEAVIHAEGLGKRYRVGERERYLALRDILARIATAPFRRDARKRDYLWALRDVSFDIRQGEVVGLIGRNGSGKTTLLKLLSRITRPTAGFAELRGRVGSLLEVGTGFHPELTGRENIYLSGAVLGMRQSEINARFDEIVAFSEVERFLDTPLKHFSTGMQMRLAFAVAAHLEPEILLVDEVLAVGDIEFQKRCLGKMQEVSESGRTIIFVSHQMNQIRRLCERVIWIDGGQLQRDGSAKEIVNAYEVASLSREKEAVGRTEGCLAFHSWCLEGTRSNRLDLDELSGPAVINFQGFAKEGVTRGIMVVILRSHDSTILWSGMYPELKIDAGPWEFSLSFDRLPLHPGIYTWDTRFYDGHRWLDHIQVPEFSIVSETDTDIFDYLKGPLNLDVSFDLMTQKESKMDLP